ncbi:hypothetical protein BH09PAT3_BH09PAT3_1010 [soil metagenome]
MTEAHSGNFMVAAAEVPVMPDPVVEQQPLVDRVLDVSCRLAETRHHKIGVVERMVDRVFDKIIDIVDPIKRG